jgi:glycosyltransferase 2 family protein
LNEPGASRWQGIRRWLPGLFISLLAVFFLVRLTNWEDLRQALLMMDLRWLPLALLAYLLSMALRAFAWATLLQHKASIWRVFLTLNEGYLLNNLFPFRLGELGRAFLLGGAINLSPLFIFSTIFIERAYDLAIASGLLLATLPLVLGVEYARPAALATLALVVVGLVSLFLAARNRNQIKRFLERTAGRWQFFRSRLLPRLDSLLDGLGTLTHPVEFFVSVAFIVASWLFGAAEYHILLNSGIITAPFWWTGFVLGVISAGIALPSAPAAIGVFEAAAVGSLALLGVPAGEALAFAIVAHVLHVAVTSVIGIYALLRDGETLTGLYRKLRGLPAS